MLRKSFVAFTENRGMLMSAALAFYTALSFAPAFILLLWVTSAFGQELQDRLVKQVAELGGAGADEVVRMVLQQAEQQPTLTNLAGVLAAMGILFSATTLLVQVQSAMNLIWRVEPEEQGALRGLVQKRLLSGLILLAMMVLVAAAMAGTAVITDARGAEHADGAGGGFSWWQLVNNAITFVVFTVGVWIMYRFLPDRDVRGHKLWVGAAGVALLLVLGKYLTSWYFGRTAFGSAYGAAGSFFVLLMWAYYSWAIVLWGAEFTHAWERRGERRRRDGPVAGNAAT